MPKSDKIQALIRTIPDFPKPGILFYDISTLLVDPLGFDLAISALEERLKPGEFDLIAGIDSRGFIFGSALAARLRKGLILVRKPGKLPGMTHKVEYSLEYGTASLEICDGVIPKDSRVLLVDDLLATGGTAKAALDLLRSQPCTVEQAIFLIELKALEGRACLDGVRCSSVLEV